MRLEKPRLEPLELDEIDSEIRSRFGSGKILNIFRTLAHQPKLIKSWLSFGTYLLSESTLPARYREIAILRVGWLCRCGYEWGQHVVIARSSGLSDEEIERIAAGFHARVVQHEVDHLDGVLFPMRMTDLSLLMFTEEMRHGRPEMPPRPA